MDLLAAIDEESDEGEEAGGRSGEGDAGAGDADCDAATEEATDREAADEPAGEAATAAAAPAEADPQPLPQLPIRPEFLRAIVAHGFQNERTRISPEALELASGLIRCFALEALHRAVGEAEEDGADEVRNEHLERALPQLLLDMGP